MGEAGAMGWIADILQNPESAFRRARGRAEPNLARIFLACTAASALLGFLVAADQRLNLAQLLAMLLLSWTAISVWAQVKTLWTHSKASERRAESRVGELRFLLSLSLLPANLILPFALIGRAAGIWFSILGGLAAACWCAALWGRAVRVHTRLPAPLAVRVAFSPALIYFIAGAALVLSFLALLFRFGSPTY